MSYLYLDVMFTEIKNRYFTVDEYFYSKESRVSAFAKVKALHASLNELEPEMIPEIKFYGKGVFQLEFNLLDGRFKLYFNIWINPEDGTFVFNHSVHSSIITKITTLIDLSNLYSSDDDIRNKEWQKFKDFFSQILALKEE